MGRKRNAEELQRLLLLTLYVELRQLQHLLSIRQHAEMVVDELEVSEAAYVKVTKPHLIVGLLYSYPPQVLHESYALRESCMFLKTLVVFINACQFDAQFFNMELLQTMFLYLGIELIEVPLVAPELLDAHKSKAVQYLVNIDLADQLAYLDYY